MLLNFQQGELMFYITYTHTYIHLYFYIHIYTYKYTYVCAQVKTIEEKCPVCPT